MYTQQVQAQTNGWPLHVIDNTSFGADGTKLSDVDHDGDLDIICGWEQGKVARLYINSFPDERWPYVEVDCPDVEDALSVDLDSDGNPDIVTFSEGETKKITIHWAPDKEDYLKKEKWISTDVPCSLGFTQWMFGQPMDVDGKNGVDLVVGGKNDQAIVAWLESPEEPRKMSEWVLHKIADAGWIMSIEILDIDHDGLTDILISDRYGNSRGLKWYKNPGPDLVQNSNAWNNHAIGLQNENPMFLDFTKSEQNGPWEIWIATADSGIFHFTQEDKQGIRWDEEKIAFPIGAGLRGKSACVGDMDGDGINELITTYEKAEGKSGVICSYFDKVKNLWISQDVSGTAGIKYDFARLLDLDQDGDLDIITSEENNNSDQIPGLGVIWYENPHIKK